MSVQGQGAKNRQHTQKKSSINSDNCPGKGKGKRRGMFEDDEGGQELGCIEEKESAWRFRGEKDRVLQFTQELINSGRPKGSISSEYGGKALEIF